MKLFLDTANLQEIREVASWGILDGVTTNPTLCSKENVPFEKLVREICGLVSGPVSVECVSTRAEEIVPEARKLNGLAPNIAIKIPVNLEGLKATRILSAEGIKVNMTLVFSPSQALLAAKAGAAFVSPFIGRLDDVSHHGMELVEQILTIYENYNFETEVIVASVRHPGHVVEAALLGAHIATVPYSVMEKLVKHPLTDIGIDKFLQDWKKVAGK
ncbi:MAG: fructose-6-phosphate aldolase [Candidatus Saccharicenans sp.]|jgi:transaldolase|nr:fructose-6-phosphate aldolase [Candidatus Saccharicenans sp.]MDH7575225.1 fructose-6-phosphate aldolase [Candidatus Saccharicenans sp.]